jgi:hypothetical protein
MENQGVKKKVTGIVSLKDAFCAPTPLSPSAPALLPSQHEEATLKQQIQLTMD